MSICCYRINVGFADASGIRYGILVEAQAVNPEEAQEEVKAHLSQLGMSGFSFGACAPMRMKPSTPPRMESSAVTISSLRTYEEFALSEEVHPRKGENIYFSILAMCSEAGEVAGAFHKVIRDHGGIFPASLKEHVEHELGDLLWGITAVADCIGSNLTEVTRKNMTKLTNRWIKKKGHAGNPPLDTEEKPHPVEEW